MKRLVTGAVLLVLFTSSCGYTQRDGEMIGQVKKIVRATPLICPEYLAADVSLGVLRGGVGSMSTQDMWLVVEKAQEPLFRAASENGKIVKIHYDVTRFGGRFFVCTPDHFATSIEYSD